jgi:hypothetical protein
MYKKTSVIMTSAIAAVLALAVVAFALPNQAMAQTVTGGNGGIGGAGGAGGTAGNGGINLANGLGSTNYANGGNANGGHGGNANGGGACFALGTCSVEEGSVR